MSKFKVSNETLVGVFTALAITILILGYNFLKGNNMFSSDTVVFAYYPKTDGLIKSNHVLYRGLKVGTVSSMEIDDASGRVRAKMEIKEGIFIPKLSVARIVSSDLLGTKAIEIQFSHDSGIYIEDGDTLIAQNEPTLGEQIDKQVLPVKLKAESLLGSLDSLTQRLQYIFRDESVDKGLESFLSSLENIRHTTSMVDGFVKEETGRLAQLLGNLTVISDTLKTSMKSISNTLSNVSEISDSLADVNFATQLKVTLDNANKSFSELELMLKDINAGKGTLGLLTKDEELYNNLNSAIGHLDTLLAEMDEYPSFVIFNKDKRKKEKKEKK